MTQTDTTNIKSLKPADFIEFKTLAEDAPVMLWQTNVDGDIIFSNTRWKQFVDTKKVETEDGNAWYEALHPDDRKHCLDTFQDAFISHDAFEMEYRHVLDTGEPYIGSNKMFAEFIGSSTDITERNPKNNCNALMLKHQRV